MPATPSATPMKYFALCILKYLFIVKICYLNQIGYHMIIQKKLFEWQKVKTDKTASLVSTGSALFS